eukprot:scaffold264864_cov15-Tisochrysis_lutea.AAC.1
MPAHRAHQLQVLVLCLQTGCAGWGQLPVLCASALCTLLPRPYASAMLPCPSVPTAMLRHAPCASCHPHAL